MPAKYQCDLKTFEDIKNFHKISGDSGKFLKKIVRLNFFSFMCVKCLHKVA